MQKKGYMLIGNWKMYMSTYEARAWLESHTKNLATTLKGSGHSLVLCPSFDALFLVQQFLKDSSIEYGAQDCSEHIQGAYTGQVSAQSLQDLGCSYGIIGHSEVRQFHAETSDIVAQKMVRLLEHAITPIICIGESHQDYLNGKAQEHIKKQLKPIERALTSYKKSANLIIAYEPIWSIGTGIVPEVNYLESIFEFINSLTASWPKTTTFKLLYGGSVNEKSSIQLKNIAALDGFLVGKASTDPKKLSDMLKLL
ncbi:MAG: triose-phosphate isomerase [Candidatus Babeliales bacterium]